MDEQLGIDVSNELECGLSRFTLEKAFWNAQRNPLQSIESRHSNVVTDVI